MDPRELIIELKSLCELTGTFIRENFGKVRNDQVEIKEKNSLVSFVDKGAEKQIIRRLKELIPETGFYTEEDSVVNSENEVLWIVDPLDGTTNFITGIPHFSISIALGIRHQIEIGVVYDVMQSDFYHAIKGKGAYVNDRKIEVASASSLDSSMIATGFPYDKKKIDERVQSSLIRYVTKARGVRRLGSASLDLCFVAKGTFNLYYEKFLNAWDIAAGALIVEEAGGKVTDFNGSMDFLFEGDIIATGKNMENESAWLVNFFKK